MSVRILHGDMLAALPTLDADSIDAVVTDPPYHLTSIVKRFGSATAAPCKVGQTGAFARASRGFMGQTWDGGDIAMRPETWAEVYRVMKPGAHLVAFGGTRTYHRMACAIEDAGFEIRDTLAWLYGSGFPKSHDVAKGIDKSLGRVGEVVPTGEPQARMIPGADQNGTGSWIKDNGRTYQPGEYQPATEEAASWEGWGSALKPAFEPIILARKPLQGTIAANVLRHGVGGINIDGCRIETDTPRPGRSNSESRSGLTGHGGAVTYGAYGVRGSVAVEDTTLGRFPANVLHDGSDEVLAAFPESEGQQAPVTGREPTANGFSGAVSFGGMKARIGGYEPRGDSGSAARFFYCAKADSDDRAGSKHPTVKPLALMSWLVKLITPPGGTVLDPFAGSGTTLLAADRLQLNAIGIEQSAEYVADIRRRMQSDAPLFAEVMA